MLAPAGGVIFKLSGAAQGLQNYRGDNHRAEQCSALQLTEQCSPNFCSGLFFLSGQIKKSGAAGTRVVSRVFVRAGMSFGRA